MKNLPEEGQLVRVKMDLLTTYAKFGRSPYDEMEEMKGNVYPVNAAIDDRVMIKKDEEGFAYSFYLGDIEHPDAEKDFIIDPVMFDPEQLYL